MSLAAASLALLLVMSAQLPPASGSAGPCEEVQEPLCGQEEVVYNMTSLPNLLGHQTQAEASRAVPRWLAESSACGERARGFLCLMYFPVCTVFTEPIPPCRETCEELRDGCSSEAGDDSHQWPEELKCENLPLSASTSLCIGPQEMSTAASPILTPKPWTYATGLKTSTGTPTTDAAGPFSGLRRNYPSTTPRPYSPPHLVHQTTSRPPEVDSGFQNTTAGDGEVPAALKALMTSFLGPFQRIVQLQEQNMLLMQQKMKLEIRLLEDQVLRRNLTDVETRGDTSQG